MTRIYAPEDGVHMGLQGMINEVVQNVRLRCRRRRADGVEQAQAGCGPATSACSPASSTCWKTARAGSEEAAAQGRCRGDRAGSRHHRYRRRRQVLADRRTVRRFRLDQEDTVKIGLISIDPSRKPPAARCSATASA